MRRIMLASAALGVTSCSNLPLDAVSIRPIYGWVDGCTDVKVSGHGFDDDISVKLGGQALEGLTLPDPEANPLDVGYVVYGVTPPASEAGYADLEVTSGGETDTVKDAFYYVACPADPYVEAASTDTAAAGDTIVLSGCNLDASAYQVQVGGETVALSSECGTATVSFTAPDLDDGCYYVHMVDASGNVLDGCGADTCGGYDTGDTGAAMACDGLPTLTYGGAR